MTLPAPASLSRNHARVFFSGLLVLATALAMHQVSLQSSQAPAPAHRGIAIRFIDATAPASPIYDAEHSMSSSERLNRWDALVAEASKRFHVPKAWIRAVMRQETGGRTVLAADKPIVSRAGALGLMQVMPDTYEQMARVHKLGDDPQAPRANIMAGTAYLRWLHARYGYPKMFAAYNAGPTRVARGGKLPAETRAYVGGITQTLKTADKGDVVNLTRPNGATVQIKAEKVVAIRQPLPGEYPKTVKAVLVVGKKHQAVRENVTVAMAAVRATGGLI